MYVINNAGEVAYIQPLFGFCSFFLSGGLGRVFLSFFGVGGGFRRGGFVRFF